MKMRLLAALAIVLVAGCSTTFLAYEGRSDLVFEGRGGARTVVDGIDFWQHGDPPRTYQLIGYIKDKRGRGLISTLTKEGNIASKAKEVGGDAVMVLEANQTITGYARSAFVTGNRRSLIAGAISVPIGTSEATFAVLKYVSFGGDPTAASTLQPAGIPLNPTVGQPARAPVANSSSNPYGPPEGTTVARAAPASSVGGVYAYEAEKMARRQQCDPARAAILLGTAPGQERYDVACTSGKTLHVMCAREGCSELKLQ